jgi:hypothetical protein
MLTNNIYNIKKYKMKKIIIIMFATTLVVSSCKKEKSTTIVVPVPTISMEILGPKVVSTTVGSSFVDSYGANFHNENGGIDFIANATSSNLDLNTPGFYNITYSAKTQYGYTAKASRLVLVTSISSSKDYSGIYARTANSQTVTIAKTGTGLYTTDNIGGVAGSPDYVFPVYFGLINDSVVVIPSQTGAAIGDFQGLGNGKLVITAVDTSFQWKLDGSAFGTSLRTFVKQ